MDSTPNTEKELTLNEHINDNANLLAVFGALNAVIVFTDSLKTNNQCDALTITTMRGLNNVCVAIQLLGFTLYAMSFFVLYEIIRSALNKKRSNLVSIFNLLLILASFCLIAIFYAAYERLLIGLLIFVTAAVLSAVLEQFTSGEYEYTLKKAGLNESTVKNIKRVIDILVFIFALAFIAFAIYVLLINK
jgi:hypothetical protein